MKKIITIIVCLILSGIMAFVLPNVFSSETKNVNSHNNEVSLISQKVINGKGNIHSYRKIYYAGKLIGVITNEKDFDRLIDDKYKQYKSKFNNASISLLKEVYFVDEKSDVEFENIDSKIVDYLFDNDLLGIKTFEVDIIDAEGKTNKIYVDDLKIFEDAKNKFVSFFVSKDTIDALDKKVNILSPEQEGESVDTNYSIVEKIETKEAISSPDDIYTSTDEVFKYLCYGKDFKEHIYPIKAGETIQYICQQNDGMSPKTIVMLNQDKIKSVDQILVPGTEISVVPNWQLSVMVTTQTRAQEQVLPEDPIYQEDESIKRGEFTIDVQEEIGLDLVLYEDYYINGQLIRDDNDEIINSKVLERETIKEPVQGHITVGSMTPINFGSKNWGWPTANPLLTCTFTCYTNHNGIDIQNRGNFWGEVLAADNGVVQSVGWTDVGGYYVRIDHNNGFVTYYGHFRSYPYVAVGDVVERGDVLGPIGMTGIATGPHVHFAMYYEGKLIDPCTQVACSLIPWA